MGEPEARLPSHLEVAGLIRRAQAAGGFAAVLHKGERDAGTIVVSLTERGAPARLFERMPQPDGSRAWALARREDPAQPQDYSEYLARRAAQDRDLWIVELDIADGERLIGFTPPRD
ncbi:MAG: DUF1491 family protein [Novosphingobium sp.]